MKPKLTPALCEFLKAIGCEIDVLTIMDGETSPETQEIHIILKNILKEEQDGYLKEILILAKEV